MFSKRFAIFTKISIKHYSSPIRYLNALNFDSRDNGLSIVFLVDQYPRRELTEAVKLLKHRFLGKILALNHLTILRKQSREFNCHEKIL